MNIDEKIKVSTQTELDAAIAAGITWIEVHGEWDRLNVSGTVKGSIYVYGTVKGSIDVSGTVKGSIYVYGTGSVGSIYVSGTVKGSIYVSGTGSVGSIYVYGTGSVGSIYVYGTVKGSIDVSGTVKGSIYVYGTGSVGSIYVYGTVKGSIYVSGTVKGSIYVSGTVKGSIDVSGTVKGSYAVETPLDTRKFFSATVADIKADHAEVLKLALPEEIKALRAALVAGKIDGHIYEGECACLVGTIEKFRSTKSIPRDATRLAEKWYIGITRGNTPKTSVLARLAVDWIDEFLKS